MKSSYQLYSPPVRSPLPAALLAMCVLASPFFAHADTLRDVKSSRAMQKVELATEQSRKRRDGKGGDDQSWYNGMDPQSNFALLWGNSKGSNLLFSWAGMPLPEYKSTVSLAKRYREFVLAQVVLVNRARATVKVDIMVPHPTYRSMVQYKTIRQFNQFEPPTMRVVAEESIEANGKPARYFRSERGQCSILVKLAQNSLVNISVNRCENSRALVDVATHLDYGRLEMKLNS